MSALNQPHFQDADQARVYLEALRWPDGPVCPHCGVVGGHYALQGKAHRVGLWKCKDCRAQFSVTVGTVFERSKIKLHIWLQAVYLLCCSKKGMSSKQLERMLGVTYKTAWFMTMRIREAFRDGNPGLMGGGCGIVEADETYWGNARPMDRNTGKRVGGSGHKHKIFTLVDRKGAARSFHVASVTATTLKPIMEKQIAKDTHLMTDGAWQYRKMNLGLNSHEILNHAAKEYARPSVAVKGVSAHSNTVESFFGIFKRGLMGTYHHVSEAHLQRYCDEFDFRFTHRISNGVNDNERTRAALRQIAGKRLTYRRTNGSQSAA